MILALPDCVPEAAAADKTKKLEVNRQYWRSLKYLFGTVLVLYTYVQQVRTQNIYE